VIVFTQYDRLLRTKRFELEEDNEGDSLDPMALAQRSEEQAQEALTACVKFLKNAMKRLEIPMAPYVNVSSMILIRYLVGVDLPLAHKDYDEMILPLVEVTLNHVQDKLTGDAVNIWVIWAMAQRVHRPIKIRTCVR